MLLRSGPPGATSALVLRRMRPVVGGTYEVLEKLREGGMGAVYRVRHLLLDELRVIKVLRTAAGDDPHARERFLREAQLARRLSHRNVVVLHDLGAARPGTYYMVLELVDGGRAPIQTEQDTAGDPRAQRASLADVLETGRLLPVGVLLDVAAQALDGLAYLHAAGIVHRDVSPENVMVAEEAGRPVAKIIDLGVAKRPDEEGLTTTGIFVGKLRYASPEQLGALPKGKAIDGRSDVYSMGCVLYHLLTGSPAYLAETPQAWVRQHVLERPRPFATTDRTTRVPEPVRHAVLRALAKDRAARFADAAELAATLRALRDDLASERGEAVTNEEVASGRAILALATRAARAKASPATIEELVAAGLVEDGTPELPTIVAAEDSTVRLSSARGSPGASRDVGPSRARTTAALAASLALVAGAAGLWLALRSLKPAPGPASPAAPHGALVVNATPWGRVVSIVEESTAARFDAAGVVTPCRLTLPSGRWRVVVRGADGSESAAVVAVRPGEPAALHVDLPGFDLESAVRSFVPDER